MCIHVECTLSENIGKYKYIQLVNLHVNKCEETVVLIWPSNISMDNFLLSLMNILHIAYALTKYMASMMHIDERGNGSLKRQKYNAYCDLCNNDVISVLEKLP